MKMIRALAVLAAATALQAHYCAYPSLCQLVQPGAAIFVGRVIQRSDKGTAYLQPRWASFRIEKIYQGLLFEKEVVVVNGQCGFDFTPGTRWIVIARRERWIDPWYTTTQFGTAEYRPSSQVVAYLDWWFGGRKTAVLWGQLRLGIFDPPVSAYPLTVTATDSAGRTFQTKSNGVFSFTSLAYGLYRLAAQGEGFRMLDEPTVVEVNRSGCTEVALAVPSSASIHACLRANGPAELSVIAESPPSDHIPSLESGVDNKTGCVAFENLYPGRYWIAGRTWPAEWTYFPGVATRDKATPIDLKRGQQVRLKPFRIQ